MDFSSLPQSLDFDDISLVTRVTSNIDHRSDCNTGVEFCGSHLSFPLIASPMTDVVNLQTAITLHHCGCMGILPRFTSIDDQVKQLVDFSSQTLSFNVGCAIGVADNWYDRFLRLYDNGCKIFCFDVAAGNNSLLHKAIKHVNNRFKDIYIIAGNVFTAECFAKLCDFDIAAIRINVANGSQCKTRNTTGMYYGQVSVINECVEQLEKLPDRSSRNIKILSCGGIRGSDDICKSLALGADCVMCGSLVAACKESAAMFIKRNGVVYKLYRGQASYGAMLERHQVPKYVEGSEDWLPYYGKLSKLIQSLTEGLRSSMSYVGARNLTEYRDRVSFVRTGNSYHV